jgi:hypothetical protein
MDPTEIRNELRNHLRECARAAYEASQQSPAGEKLAGIEYVCDELAAYAYALGYNAARDDTLERELQREPRWNDQCDCANTQDPYGITNEE